MNSGIFNEQLALGKYRAIARLLIDLERIRGMFDFELLATDTENALASSSEISVEFDPSPRAGCSVFGYYQAIPSGQSRIVVHPSHTSARDRFTILHELGHHVQRQHLEWAALRHSLAGRAGDRLEERVADAFAAEVLIPSDDELETSTLSASSLSEVHSQSRASRSAVAMRAIEIAPESENAVVIVCDIDGIVIFARGTGDDVFTPARGLAQPSLLPMLSKAAAGTGRFTGELSQGLQTLSGWSQGELAAEIALDQSGEYAFVILRPMQRFGRKQVWTQSNYVCSSEACGEHFVRDETVVMCNRCKGPKCPACSGCSCEVELGKVCTKCFLGLSKAEQSGDVEHVCA